MRRRVGSANAAKVRFKVFGEYLTIWLTIKPSRRIVQVKNFGVKNQPSRQTKKGDNHIAASTRNERYHACWAISFPLYQIFYTTMVLLKLG